MNSINIYIIKNSLNVMRGAPRPLYIYYTFFIAVPFMVSFPRKTDRKQP